MQKNPGSNPPNFTPARRPSQQPNTKGALDFLQSNDRLAALLPALGVLLVLVGDAVAPARRSWQPLLGVAVLLVAAGTALATGLRPAGFRAGRPGITMTAWPLAPSA